MTVILKANLIIKVINIHFFVPVCAGLASTGAGGQSQYRPGGGAGGAASGGSQASPGRPGGRPTGGM